MYATEVSVQYDFLIAITYFLYDSMECQHVTSQTSELCISLRHLEESDTDRFIHRTTFMALDKCMGVVKDKKKMRHFPELVHLH